uniref:HNH nuclease domain-containing protein n=1 Tax=viral metagenome TaxID=1070528 RepID=A0A6C0EYD8_9ZZZZ
MATDTVVAVDGGVDTAVVTEEWRKVEGYPNYEVSSLGRVRNLLKNKKEKILKGSKDCAGYMRVCLTNKIHTKTLKVHILVGRAFHPNPEKKKEINHLGAKDDNRACMLEWVTHQENCIHATKYITKFKKTAVHKIDIDSNEIIKTYDKISDTIIDGFNIKTISSCINGKRKTHGGFRWQRVTDKPIVSTENLEGEIWFNLKDSIYDECKIFINYKVSNFGRVKGYKDKLMEPNTSTGRSVVNLVQGKKNKNMKVHRMVLMASNTPNPENKPEVDHIDSNPKNHHLDNLRWATKEDQKNNINTKIKLVTNIKLINVITKEEKIYNGINILANELGSGTETIKKYAKSGETYKGYKFVIIPK